MFAVLYLLVCLFFGTQFIRFMVPDVRRLFLGIAPNQDISVKVPSILFTLPAGMVIGVMSVTFVTYYAAFLFYRFVPGDMHPLYPANIFALCLFCYLGSLFGQKAILRKMKKIDVSNTTDKGDHSARSFDFDRSVPMILMLSLVTIGVVAAAAYISFYSFHMDASRLCVGESVASDFGPHIAVASSFSKGSNFPTQYPHFPGDKIQYHFFFYFLCGNLNLLGLPLDFAFNIPFILTFAGAIVLLGTLAVLLSGRRLAFAIVPALVLFRSSLNIFYQISDLIRSYGWDLSRLFRVFSEQDSWYELTPYDNWGLWAINVYANQRHLMLGVSVVLILLFLFIPHLRRMFLHLNKTGGIREKLRLFFASRSAWIWRRSDPLSPNSLLVVAFVLVITVPFFHGSMLISAMIILFGMAVFSENRLSYAAVAIAAVGSSFLQTTFFAGNVSNVVSLRQHSGFILYEPTFSGIAEYILKLGGFAVIIPLLLFIGLIIYDFIRDRNKYRMIILGVVCLPFTFAFLALVSRDLLANHKFIQLSFLLLDIFVAGVLAVLFLLPVYSRNRSKQKTESAESCSISVSTWLCVVIRILGVVTAIVLLLSLTGTGISEWFVQHNRNSRQICLNTESEMVEWIEQNTPERSVFLTRNWYIHNFFLSGRMIYYGHPYYAWSAGHDTDSRFHDYEYLITGCNGNPEEFRRLCREKGIEYIILDIELRSYQNEAGEYVVNSDFFFENFLEVAHFPDESDAYIFAINY